MRDGHQECFSPRPSHHLVRMIYNYTGMEKSCKQYKQYKLYNQYKWRFQTFGQKSHYFEDIFESDHYIMLM